jgi:predicted DCC family thiol-disulfide oxidoreductase YuxK
MLNYPVILFDGVCVLCNRAVDFILRFDRKKQFRYVAQQSVAGKILIQKFRIPSEINSVILIFNNQVYIESEALIKISSFLSFPWNTGIILKIFPKKFNDFFYQWIAKNRYNWFGRKKACRIATLEERKYFLDSKDLNF